ncbi:MAG: alpha/beta hydrolase [Marinicella sp.]
MAALQNKQLMPMKKKLIFTMLFLIPLISDAATKRAPYEMPRTQVIPLKESASGNQYELYIKLPDNYNENKDVSYPVIYFTDAVWSIELLSVATEFLLENVILVGISWQKDISEDLIKKNGVHVSRVRDYSARKSSNLEHQAKYNFGQASQHLEFIRHDVIKFTEKNYRTEPANRTYFGYSLGGEFGAYTLMTQPDTFKNYIIGSPSFRAADVTYLAKLSAEPTFKNNNLNNRVYISYGTLEEASVHIDAFIALLKNNKNERLSLTHAVLEGSHQSAFPLTGINSVKWLANFSKTGVNQ